MHKKNKKSERYECIVPIANFGVKCLGLIWFYIINFAFYVGAEIVATFGWRFLGDFISCLAMST